MLKFFVADPDPGSGAFVTRNGKHCLSRIRNTEIPYGTVLVLTIGINWKP